MSNVEGPTPLSDYSDLQISPLLRAWDEQSSIARDDLLATSSPLIRFRDGHRALFVFSLAAPLGFLVLCVSALFWGPVAYGAYVQAQVCADDNPLQSLNNAFAEGQATGQAYADKMLKCDSRYFNTLLAKNEILTNEQYGELANTTSVITLKDLARNEGTPDKVLIQVATRSDIAQLVFTRPNVSNATVEDILQENPEWFDKLPAPLAETISSAPGATLTQGLSGMSCDDTSRVLQFMAKNGVGGELPKDISRARIDDCLDPALVQFLTVDEVITSILKIPDVNDQARALRLVQSGEISAEFYASISDPELRLVLVSPGSGYLPFSDEATALAAADESAGVRKEVARRADQAEVLALLAEDEFAEVRGWVAVNGATPKGILRNLAEDPKTLVRRGVAGNDQTPKDTLTALARDPNPDVRRGVAFNDNTPRSVVKALADDPDEKVAEAARFKL